MLSLIFAGRNKFAAYGPLLDDFAVAIECEIGFDPVVTALADNRFMSVELIARLSIFAVLDGQIIVTMDTHLDYLAAPITADIEIQAIGIASSG